MTTLQAGGVIPFLIFVAFAIIASFFEKRAKKEKDRERNPAPGQTRLKSWEEELRELLQNRPAPPPAQREVPMPSSTNIPRPIRVPAPPPLPSEQDRGIEVYLPPPQPRIEPVFEPVHGLRESQEHYAQAATLQQRVAEHLASVTHRPAQATRVKPHELRPQTKEAIEMVRNPKSLRSAILANVILGAPRALEPL